MFDSSGRMGTNQVQAPLLRVNHSKPSPHEILLRRVPLEIIFLRQYS